MLNHNNSSQIISRLYHKCAMFTMIFLSMLGEHNGEGGLGGGWELMAQWFVSWTSDQQAHYGAHARVTVSSSQARHLTLSLPPSSQEWMVLADL